MHVSLIMITTEEKLWKMNITDRGIQHKPFQ